MSDTPTKPCTEFKAEAVGDHWEWKCECGKSGTAPNLDTSMGQCDDVHEGIALRP